MKFVGYDWFITSMLCLVHLVAFGALYFYPINLRGVVYTAIMLAWTGASVTVGYHRLWSHSAYKASLPWQLFWGIGGTGAIQGSILWWSRLHRLHHNFSDTDIDPYGPQRGFLFSHCWWLFYKTDRTEDFKRIDVSDLKRDWWVMLQHRLYVPMSMIIAFVFPVLMFRDTMQAILYGGFMARVLTWHCTWCINSVAHWLGESKYSDELTATDHPITAFLTLGEGNHAFHHAFPFSYRNAVKWYDWDPTRNIIDIGYYLGMCWDLKVVDKNDGEKARYQVLAHRLRNLYQQIEWPDPALKERPITMNEYLASADERSGKVWVAMNGFVYDVTSFVSKHPGGERLLRSMAGKSQEYISSQYHYRNNHSMSARNKMDSMLIGKLVV